MQIPAAHEAILQCQSRLWELVRIAAERRDGDEVIELTELARSVGRLLGESPEKMEDLEGPGARESSPRVSRKAARKTRPPLERYPRFLKTKTDLIKLGWSKSRRSEYQHRAPFPVAIEVSEAIEALGARGKRFTAEQLLEAVAEKRESPSYQVYLVLAWLREAGVVEQIGRQGYRLSSKDQPVEAARRLLDELHEI